MMITCAVTGAIHTLSMSPHLPITPQQVATAAEAAEAVQLSFTFMLVTGNGRPDQSPEAFAPILQVVKQSTDAVVNITTGGAPTMTVQDCASCRTIQAKVASLNMGSMNLVFTRCSAGSVNSNMIGKSHIWRALLI